jgi:RimJ/RimL family protein N-acetyltransferase
MNEVLQNDTVVLRRLAMDDAEDIFHAVSESIPHLSPWMPWCHANYSLQETQNFIGKQIELWNAGEEYGFTIRNNVGAFAGLCGLNQFNRIHHFANLGYWLRQSSLGNGYATAATRMVASFGLRELKLRRVEILVAVDNYRSQQVAERVGAVREGILRQRLWIHDRAHDAVCYSVVADG